MPAPPPIVSWLLAILVAAHVLLVLVGVVAGVRAPAERKGEAAWTWLAPALLCLVAGQLLAVVWPWVAGA